MSSDRQAGQEGQTETGPELAILYRRLPRQAIVGGQRSPDHGRTDAEPEQRQFEFQQQHGIVKDTAMGLVSPPNIQQLRETLMEPSVPRLYPQQLYRPTRSVGDRPSAFP